MTFKLFTGLLDTVEVVLPFGGNMWETVELQYNTALPIVMAPRTAESCKTKFNKLKGVRKPTGDPTCPDEVRRAKHIQRAIENSMGVANFDSDHEVEEQDEDGAVEDHLSQQLYPSAAASAVFGAAHGAEEDENGEESASPAVDRRTASEILSAPTFRVPPSEATLSALTQALETGNYNTSSNSSSTSSRPPLPPSTARSAASPHQLPAPTRAATGVALSATASRAGLLTPGAAARPAAAAVSRAGQHSMGPPSTAAAQPLLAGSGRTGLTHQQLVDLGRRVDTPRSEVTNRRHRYDEDIQALTASLQQRDDSGLQYILAQSQRDEQRREQRREQIERDQEERRADRDERREREQRERDERREQRDMQYNQSLLLFSTHNWAYRCSCHRCCPTRQRRTTTSR